MRSGLPGSTICVSDVQLMTTIVKDVELEELLPEVDIHVSQIC